MSAYFTYTSTHTAISKPANRFNNNPSKVQHTLDNEYKITGKPLTIQEHDIIQADARPDFGVLLTNTNANWDICSNHLDD